MIEDLTHEFSLPPPDTGYRPWICLAACFLVEALVWGFPFSYGIFHDYYSSHEPFMSQPSGIAAIGTSAMGIMYFGCNFCFLGIRVLPWLKNKIALAGLCVMIVSLVASSFAESVQQLILTQGILYGIGGTLLYSPVIVYVDEWFVRRKGFAYGIMWAGTGFAGVTIPFIMDWGLNKYAWPTVLRGWAVVLFVLTGPLLAIIRPRIPPSQAQKPHRIDLSFLTNRTFLLCQLGNVLEGLGFFAPAIYLPLYARSMGLRNEAVTATVALLSIATVFGCIFIGILIDRFHVTTAILVSSIGATVSIFLMWGFAETHPLLCAFAVVYGFFAGSFTSTYTGIVKEVKKEHPSVDAGIIIGVLASGRGIGSIACGPLSEALLQNHPWEGELAFGYGSGYGALIVFTGVTAGLGGVSFVARRVGCI
ncbi:major facilitator superfamily domain-containing protein [Aspergillus alliaceus]|uniref:major facilitator superfamily domain-containing protein n=1 Tax=Petromyces alliaceus TaxID=209559 RepID=UPI0012A5AB3F|nr:major facilitator superfamily domain-containing protein [Aspergillus alliaceus]KAB8237138.1 major facilitator superfamily domain-containing protein [Aspergillus alliaceus]